MVEVLMYQRSVFSTSILASSLLGLSTLMALPSQPFVIGDFEGGFDHWSGDNGGVVSLDTFGATRGNGSLRVAMPEPASWRPSIKYDVLTAGTTEALLSNHLLSFDVSWRASEWVGGIHGWSMVEGIIIHAEGIGFNHLMLGFEGIWDSFNWGDEHTRRLTIDYSEIDFSALPISPAWFEVSIATHYEHDFTEGGVFYFDNITLSVIPEPTSLAILGIGFVGLLSLVRPVGLTHRR